tara:strand:- start:20414 stop:22093 length:1680 start_codon:yes stop_codon:yes gene_type:complete
MHLIEINNYNLAVNLEWKNVEGNNQKTIHRKLRKEATNNKTHFNYGAFSNTYKELKKSQYTTSNDAQFDDKVIYPAALIFLQDYKGYVIVKEVSRDEHDNIEYWVCVIDPKGKIVEDKLLNENNTDSTVSNYINIYDYKLLVFKNEYVPYDSSIEINKTILESEFKLPKNAKELKYTYFRYKGKEINKNYIVILVFAIVGLFFFFNYYETDKKIQLENKNWLKQYNTYQDEVELWKENNDRNYNRNSKSSSLEYTQNEFTNLAKKQIQNQFDVQLYSNRNIITNIREIERTIPLYLAEWKLNTIGYTNNQIIITFDKIQSSTGVFTELDYLISDINEKRKDINITKLDLTNNGLTRVYKVEFDNFKTTNTNADGETLFEIRRKQFEKISKLSGDIERLRRQIRSTSRRISDVSTFEQIFTDKLESIERQIKRKSSELEDLYKEIRREINYKPENFELNIDLNTNTFFKYIETTQINNNYDWVYPKDLALYPLIDTKQSLNYFARSYEVGAKSREGLSNNFEALINAGVELSNLNGIITLVEFDTENSSWVIKGMIFNKL